MAIKKQFLLYKNWAPMVEALPVEHAGILFKAIYAYQMTGEEPSSDEVIYPIFCLFKAKFDEDQAAYEAECERNRKNGILGGRPKTDRNREKPTGAQQNPVGFSETQSGHDKDKDNDNEKDIDTDRDKEKQRRVFVPPTVPEVQDYCHERDNGIDAHAFVDFYASKGWMVGSNKMKDWRACVRTWEKRRTSRVSTAHSELEAWANA